MKTAIQTEKGELWQATVEDALAAGLPDATLIFTSPPFGVDERWLRDTFARLARLLPHDGSLVVMHGNSWTPPNASLTTLEQLTAVVEATSLELRQTFVVEFDRAVMSPSVRGNMAKTWRKRAPDTHAHAWWLSKGGAYIRRRSLALSSVIHAPADRRYELDCVNAGIVPYHAAIPLAVPTWFVRQLTSVGDLVLDPFAGTNSTGAAAEGLDRRWLSLEPDEAKIALARCRLTSTVE